MKDLQKHIVRPGRQTDLVEMQRLLLDAVRFICSEDYNEQQINAWIAASDNDRYWNDVMKLQYVLVTTTNDRITGFGSLKNMTHIDLLYVHKDFQREGVAGRIYAELEKEAIRLKQTLLTADVSITAKPFFEKIGFVVSQEQVVVRNGVTLINYRMVKKLDAGSLIP